MLRSAVCIQNWRPGSPVELMAAVLVKFEERPWFGASSGLNALYTCLQIRINEGIALSLHVDDVAQSLFFDQRNWRETY